MKKPDWTTKHVHPETGEFYTEETYSNGAAAWTIVRNAHGQEVSTMGSGGSRPWDNWPKPKTVASLADPNCQKCNGKGHIVTASGETKTLSGQVVGGWGEGYTCDCVDRNKPDEVYVPAQGAPTEIAPVVDPVTLLQEELDKAEMRWAKERGELERGLLNHIKGRKVSWKVGEGQPWQREYLGIVEEVHIAPCGFSLRIYSEEARPARQSIPLKYINFIE